MLIWWWLPSLVALILLGIGVWWFFWGRHRPVGQKEEEQEDQVVAALEAAAAAFGNLPPMGLELPDPEVGITPDWARNVAEAAEHVAKRQRAAIAGRANRRRALRAVEQIRRGVERVRSMEEDAVDETHGINAVTQELGLDLLEVRSEEEENAAVRRLRRANDAAETV